MGSYSFSTSLTPRYRDIDANGHVNHAVYATYMEEARTAYWRTVVGGRLSEAGVAIVSLEIEYQSELSLDDAVTIEMGVGRLGNSSIPHHYRITAGDRVAALGNAVMVAFDRDTRSSRPIPDAWKHAIRTFEERDE